MEIRISKDELYVLQREWENLFQNFKNPEAMERLNITIKFRKEEQQRKENRIKYYQKTTPTTIEGIGPPALPNDIIKPRCLLHSQYNKESYALGGMYHLLPPEIMYKPKLLHFLKSYSHIKKKRLKKNTI